jgi:potassium/hydrogen antiporter
MDIAIIITFCILLLIAYFFDLTASKTKIPAVIFLLLLGWFVRQLAIFFDIHLPDFSLILPVLGTIGLILIVLEGSLELELNKSKVGMISKSFLGAFIPMIVIAFVLGYMFHYFELSSFKDSITNAIPFCVISSAIAIPSVRNLTSYNKDFVIYESSFSDILGVLFFNFVALNTIFDSTSFGNFGLQLLSMVVVSFIATLALSFLLNKIEHHIKFVPVILLVILIYAISKIYHLPSLIFILVFGLFLGNLDELRRFSWIRKFHTEKLDFEIQKFKELTIEAAFIVRSLFFLLFGYMIETSEILNTETLIWSVGIVTAIVIIRFIQMKLSKLPMKPLFFIAPRGLITILLFLSIEPEQRLALVNKALIIQVILIMALLMMVGLMITKNTRAELSPEKADEIQSTG